MLHRSSMDSIDMDCMETMYILRRRYHSRSSHYDIDNGSRYRFLKTRMATVTQRIPHVLLFNCCQKVAGSPSDIETKSKVSPYLASQNNRHWGDTGCSNTTLLSYTCAHRLDILAGKVRSNTSPACLCIELLERRNTRHYCLHIRRYPNN